MPFGVLWVRKIVCWRVGCVLPVVEGERIHCSATEQPKICKIKLCVMRNERRSGASDVFPSNLAPFPYIVQRLSNYYIWIRVMASDGSLFPWATVSRLPFLPSVSSPPALSHSFELCHHHPEATHNICGKRRSKSEYTPGAISHEPWAFAHFPSDAYTHKLC